MNTSEQIKQSVTMRQLCDQYGISVNSAGFANCPCHGEKTASMKVYDGNRGWHCFGCHKGGSVIDFVMELYGLPLLDAEKRLDADFRLGLFQTADEDTAARQRAIQAARERKKALRQRDRQHKEMWRQYDAALTAYIAADRLIDSTDGIPPYLWSDQQCEAIKEISRLSYELDEATLALHIFETENHVSGPSGIVEEVRKTRDRNPGIFTRGFPNIEALRMAISATL